MISNRELFEQYNRDVYRTCYYMVHNAADAEDLCQEVFITVFRSNTGQIEHLRAWIMKITVNLCLNHLKRQRSLLDKISSNLHLFTGTGEEKSIERQIEERESADEWAASMNRLPVKIRTVLTLRYMNDFSLTEISEMLSIPLGTTKSRLHNGLRLLKRLIGNRSMHDIKEGEDYGQQAECPGLSVK